MTASSRIVGLVLAGGKGSRLGGVDKALLRLEGVSLANRVIARLRPQCETILLSVAQATDEAPFRQYSVSVLPDRSDGPAGPAAALWAGLCWAKANAPDAAILTVTVDCPFTPLDFAQRSLDAIGDSGCVAGAYEGQIYPTHALWQIEALETVLDGQMSSDKGPSLFALLEKAKGRSVDYRAYAHFNPFQGINTVADLLSASAGIRNFTGQHTSF
ncbi:molybdenum cofactor guanylyltransferase [Pelagibacterium lentulum]|uniref:Molybdenum cofactor guanylyltransferase n=1 Tax=Pelagibacterium lentulum TaxID=2029865 RepID=A0A916RFM2_9HYPH|nr:molybdenum cofactor guanylyltransferase [Pelagibacterium lentulum]GGA51910.1 molybdenum cofactor guanylyltransferase [Pelagibacterium lentulum]